MYCFTGTKQAPYRVLLRTRIYILSTFNRWLESLCIGPDNCHLRRKWRHEVLAAIAAGTNVILCGHTNTERGYLPVLASKLQAQLEAVAFAEPYDIVISDTDEHPLEFV
ncbi:hypothetical protein F5880DRAFT_1510692 [Lentinula raphanica]|nr:hypothetical protein F5880DRAFT_1510692 [Lentinula raphanica]